MADIATLAEIKAALGIPATDTSLDSRITGNLPFAQEQVQGFSRKRWVPTTNSNELHNGDGQPFLYPFDTPIRSVSSLQLVDLSGNVIQTFASSEFAIYGKEYIQLSAALTGRPVMGFPFGVFFPVGENNVRLSYLSGLASEADIPKDVKLALALGIAFNLGSGINAGLKSERIGNYSYTKHDQPGSEHGASGSGLPLEAQAILRRYMRVEMRPATLETRSHLRQLR